MKQTHTHRQINTGNVEVKREQERKEGTFSKKTVSRSKEKEKRTKRRGVRRKRKNASEAMRPHFPTEKQNTA